MPYAPNRQCPGRGPHLYKCPNSIKGNERYCSVCIEYLNKDAKRNNKRYDEVRDQSQERQFIHSTEWRKIRLRKLAKDPLCEICLKSGRDTPAVIVHHVDGDELNNNPDGSNHLSTCNYHHEELHKDERWGKKL